jgi:hypothetical protein
MSYLSDNHEAAILSAVNRADDCPLFVPLSEYLQRFVRGDLHRLGYNTPPAVSETSAITPGFLTFAWLASDFRRTLATSEFCQILTKIRMKNCFDRPSSFRVGRLYEELANLMPCLPPIVRK